MDSGKKSLISQTTPIAVIGAGQMGTGISFVSLISGYRVFLFDEKKEFLERAKETIQHMLHRFLEKGRISQVQQELAQKSLTLTSDWSLLNRVSLVIEAVPEDETIKKNLYSAIGSFLLPQAIIATNTSSIPIKILAQHTSAQDRFVGVHFFNPVPYMPLVEIIKTDTTSADVSYSVQAFVENLGKTVVFSQDRPGFIVNRILLPMINEAVAALETEVASAVDIDKAMKLGANFPLGPLALADLIGLDTCVSILETLEKNLDQSRYSPAALFRDYIEKGWLGRKTGRGFFCYET